MEDESAVTYLIESSDKGIEQEAIATFGEDDTSVSSNFIGGVEIAVFLALGLRPIRDIIRDVLTFQAARASRYQHSKIVVGDNYIELTGYGPDDIEQIAELPMFAELVTPDRTNEET
jgi:hypothetical protein